MDQESQLALALIERNLTLSQWIEGVEIAEKLGEKNIPSKEMPQFVEAASELWDPEFRNATYAALELKKRSGKSLKEVEAYTEELGSQIADKERQNLDWDERIREAKAQFSKWEQRRKEEQARLEAEQAKNKEILEEDRRRFNEELKEHNRIRDEIKKTKGHEAKLSDIGLSMETFDSILAEVKERGVDSELGGRVEEAVKLYGSLSEAISRLAEEEAKKEELLSKLDKHFGEEFELKINCLRHLNSQIKLKEEKLKKTSSIFAPIKLRAV